LTSHHSDAMICRQKSLFYCTFDLHYGTHFRYLGNNYFAENKMNPV
jgi:hypothetical protein